MKLKDVMAGEDESKMLRARRGGLRCWLWTGGRSGRQLWIYKYCRFKGSVSEVQVVCSN